MKLHGHLARSNTFSHEGLFWSFSKIYDFVKSNSPPRIACRLVLVVVCHLGMCHSVFLVAPATLTDDGGKAPPNSGFSSDCSLGHRCSEHPRLNSNLMSSQSCLEIVLGLYLQYNGQLSFSCYKGLGLRFWSCQMLSRSSTSPSAELGQRDHSLILPVNLKIQASSLWK